MPDYEIYTANLVADDEVQEFTKRLANFRFTLQHFFDTTEIPEQELERWLYKNDGDRTVEKAKDELMGFIYDLTRYY